MILNNYAHIYNILLLKKIKSFIFKSAFVFNEKLIIKTSISIT